MSDKRVHEGNDLAEIIKFLSRFKDDIGEFGIGRLQPNADSLRVLSSSLPIPFDGEVSINGSDNDVAVRGRKRTVDDEQVSVMNTVSDHRFAGDPHEESRGGTLDQQRIKTERRFEILFGRRRKSGYDSTDNPNL